MIRYLLLLALLLLLMACENSNKEKQERAIKAMDTVYLTNPKTDKDFKPLIIFISSYLSNEAVEFDVGNKDTIMIKVKGISNYPLMIKNAKNISLDQINDSLFYMQVLDTMVYFEIWQDYGKGNVLSKVKNSKDSICFIPYDGVKQVGRILYPN